jgi:hypothetical protein
MDGKGVGAAGELTGWMDWVADGAPNTRDCSSATLDGIQFSFGMLPTLPADPRPADSFEDIAARATSAARRVAIEVAALSEKLQLAEAAAKKEQADMIAANAATLKLIEEETTRKRAQIAAYPKGAGKLGAVVMDNPPPPKPDVSKIDKLEDQMRQLRNMMKQQSELLNTALCRRQAEESSGDERPQAKVHRNYDDPTKGPYQKFPQKKTMPLSHRKTLEDYLAHMQSADPQFVKECTKAWTVFLRVASGMSKFPLCHSKTYAELKNHLDAKKLEKPGVDPKRDNAARKRIAANDAFTEQTYTEIFGNLSTHPKFAEFVDIQHDLNRVATIADKQAKRTDAVLPPVAAHSPSDNESPAYAPSRQATPPFYGEEDESFSP